MGLFCCSLIAAGIVEKGTMKASKNRRAGIPLMDSAVARTAKSRQTYESPREIVATERRWLMGQISSPEVVEAEPREVPAVPQEPAPAPPVPPELAPSATERSAAKPMPSGSNYRVVLACTSRSKGSPNDTA
jgi:hypothetical protein